MVKLRVLEKYGFAPRTEQLAVINAFAERQHHDVENVVPQRFWKFPKAERRGKRLQSIRLRKCQLVAPWHDPEYTHFSRLPTRNSRLGLAEHCCAHCRISYSAITGSLSERHPARRPSPVVLQKQIRCRLVVTVSRYRGQPGRRRHSRATAACLGRDASMSRDRTLSLPAEPSRRTSRTAEAWR